MKKGWTWEMGSQTSLKTSQRGDGRNPLNPPPGSASAKDLEVLWDSLKSVFNAFRRKPSLGAPQYLKNLAAVLKRKPLDA